MTDFHGNGEYKNLLDGDGHPSLESAEFHQASESLGINKIKSFCLRNAWILHLAMVILYSTIFILMARKYHAQCFHGPDLIFCMSGQS